MLIPVNEVRKACGIPEPAKSVQILFRGGHSLGVWDLEAHTTLEQLFSGGKRGGDMDGYFFHDWRADPQFGGGGLQSGFVASFGVLLAWVRVVVFRVLGEFGQWTCSKCGKTDCWSTRNRCYRSGCPRYFVAAGVGQVRSGGQGKGGGVAGFHGQGVGGGMSGVRLVGAVGRDQTYVSTGNPSYRKGNGRRGGAREGAVPGAGVGPGSGGNRVRFQEMLEKDGVLANKSGFWCGGS